MVGEARQLGLDFKTWGGRRRGAGRKPMASVAGVPHARRARLSGREPLHVTLKIASKLPSLRTGRALGLLKSILGSRACGSGFG